MPLPRAAAFFLLLLTTTVAAPARAQVPVPPPAPAATPPAPAAYQPPKPLERPPLSYPELAKLNHITGVLRVLLTVDETGRVVDSSLVKGTGSMLLDQVAFDPGLRAWTFRPATIGGKPVTGTYEQELEFRLDPEEQRILALRRSALLPTAGTPDPPYPDAARGKALRGRTTLVVTWGDNGLVERIGLQQSSNSGLLDVTALRWAYEHWRVDRAQFKEAQFVKTIVFDPDRPARAAALSSETPPPLGAPTPTSSPAAASPTPAPTPTPTPKKR